MLSVVIATENAERSLVPTLAALVPGATAALVAEVIIADAGSRDATAQVADYAGCRMIVSSAPLGARLAEAAASARAPWLLFLKAGDELQPGWIEEVSRFIEQPLSAGPGEGQAAVFRQVAAEFSIASPVRQAMRLLAEATGLRRAATRGLLIQKQRYLRLGGHSAKAVDPELELMQRLSRRQVITLRSGAIAG